MRRAASLAACAALVGCAPAPQGRPPSAPAAQERPELSALAARSFDRRPVVVAMAREGDPAGALAVDVALPDLVAATGLLAVVEVRLAKAGVQGVDGQADRLGLRVRVVVPDGEAAERATREVLRALTSPIAEEGAAIRLAAARTAALTPADDPALRPLLDCTGEARLAGEPRAEVTATSLEAARERSVGWATVTVGFVGSAAVGAKVAEAVARAEPWQREGARAGASPVPAELAYVEPTRRRGTTRVVVARASGDPFDALTVASPDHLRAVTAHLARAGAPGLARAQATAHARGSCTALEVEVDGEAEDAARVARLLRDELARPVVADPSAIARAVSSQADPRDAAAAAALMGRAARADARPRILAALGAAPPRGKAPDLDAARRDAQASLVRALSVSQPSSSGVEVRAAAEPGQREAWVALGSTCPIPDADAGAGLTAAVVTAQASRELDGVTLEPWVSPTDAGILAHAPPRAGELAADHVRRVARAAAVALLSGPPAAEALERARVALLVRLDEPSLRAQEPVVGALARGRVSHFLPWGTTDGLARVAPARSRWAALASGPLRAAVVATSSVDHATAAAEVIERLARGSEARACPSVGAWERPAPGARAASLPVGLGPRAYVVAQLDGRDRVLAAALAAWAGDPDAAATRAARAQGVTARAYLLGEGAATLLVVELSGPALALETAASELSASLAAAAKAPGEAELARAIAAAREDDWRARATPRRRVLDRFRGGAASSPPTPAALTELARRAFAVGNTSVVSALGAASPAQSPASAEQKK